MSFLKPIDAGQHFLDALAGQQGPSPRDYERFTEQVARSFRLYQRGLITDKEFIDVTANDLHFMDRRARYGDDL